MAEQPHPTGQVPAHAPARMLDLEAAADRLTAQLNGSGRQTESLAREGGASVLMMAMPASDEVREHSAPGTVTVHALRGHAVVSTEGDSFELTAGRLVVFQPGVRHAVRAVEQSVILLTIAGGAPE